MLSRDVKKSGIFYQNALGYELVNSGQINGSDKFLFVSEGYARAALMAISPQRQDVMPCWLPSLRVESVPETIAKAQQLGGTVLVSPRQDLFSGRTAVIADPSGGAIGIMEWDAEQEDTK